MKIKILLFALFLCLPAVCLADVRPTYFNKGGNIYIGQETKVEMVSEVVLVDNFRKEKIKVTAHGEDFELDTLVADFTADFVMKNTGVEDEEMRVSFPFYFVPDEEIDQKTGVYNILVFINGKKVNFKKSLEKNEIYFNTIFKALEEKNIRVKYTSAGSNTYWGHDGFEFGYILESGQGWKGSIGQGEFIVNLPYTVSKYNISFYEKYSRDERKREFEYSGDRAIYKFENLEPTEDDNLIFYVFDINEWKNYLELYKKAEENSLSWEAQKNLFDFYNEWSSFGEDDILPFSSNDYFKQAEKYLGLKYQKEEKPLEYYQFIWDIFFNNGTTFISGKGQWFDFSKTKYGDSYVIKRAREYRNKLALEEELKYNEEAKKLLEDMNNSFFTSLLYCTYKEDFNDDELYEFYLNGDILIDENLKDTVKKIKGLDSVWINRKDQNRWYKMIREGDFSFLDDYKFKTGDEIEEERNKNKEEEKEFVLKEEVEEQKIFNNIEENYQNIIEKMPLIRLVIGIVSVLIIIIAIVILVILKKRKK